MHRVISSYIGVHRVLQGFLGSYGVYRVYRGLGFRV